MIGALIGVVLLVLASSAFADDGNGNSQGQGGGSNSKPGVVAVAATDVGSTGALLRAYVNPSGHATSYVFEYGTTTAYGSRTASTSAGSSDAFQAASARVDGLVPGAVYHYRLVATNSKGTTAASDRGFTTLSALAPGSPTGGPNGTSGSTGDATIAPELGTSVAVKPGRGMVRVRLPGSSSFAALRSGSELPLGSELDASRGDVALTTALPSGKTQTGRFGGGRFLIRQDRSGLVDLYLRGSFCKGPKAKHARGLAVASRGQAPTRKLWGRDHRGRFRTHGKNSQATVRGTRWLVQDRCDGTLTRVTEGSVVVRDTVRAKRIVLHAGESYLARPRR